jgi:type IV pilus assembly protein PilW
MKSHHKGFTAIELLVSMALLSMTLGSIYGLYMSFVQRCTTESVKINVQQRVRSGLDMMIRDIRMAGLDPAATGEFGIVSATSQRIQFTIDRDMDGELDNADISDGIDAPDIEHIAYEWDGSGTIRLNLYKADGTLELSEGVVRNVTDLSFNYFDADNVATSVIDDIRTVGIQMTIQRTSGRDGPVSLTLVKRVTCRNLEFQ